MSDYLDTKEFPGCSDIPLFKVIHVPFKWQSSNYRESESGNFLMMHMLDYEGKVYESDLSKKSYRYTLSVELAVTLALADCNAERKNLLASVAAFSRKKHTLLKDLVDKRKLQFYATKQARLHAEALEEKQPAIGGGRGRGRGRGRGHV